MGGILYAIRNWWEKSDRNQRTVSVGGAGLLFLLLIGTFLFASRPHYALLYTDMSEADKGAVVSEIQAMGIGPKYDVAGEIEVPADKLEEINMHLASSGKLPKSVHLGLADLDKMNLMTTPAQEKVRLQSMLEGELSKSIESLEGVQAARVHISPGDDSPFTSTHKPATAAVAITESATGHLTPEQGRAVATLVKSAVEGLEMQNITVLNQRMEFLYNGADQNGSQNAANVRSTLESDESQRRGRELQGKLDQVFGPGTTVVSVHAELDLDTMKTDSDVQQPTDAINTSKVVEKMTGPGAKAGGVSGLSSNTAAPAALDKGSGGNAQYQNTNENVVKGVNETKTVVEKMPGAVKSLLINVMADSTKITDAKQTDLKSFIDNEVKNHAQDAVAFTTNVTFVPFDTASAAEIAKSAAAAATQSRTQQIFSLLPIGALLIIALMVMKQVSKFAKTQTALVSTPDGQTFTMSLDANGNPSPISAASLLAAIEGSPQDGAIGFDGRSASSLEPGLDVADIKDKVHMPLEQLKKMAHERPQVVTMLIKSLLLEDRR